MIFAHRGLIEDENSIQSVLNAYEHADAVEVDVRYNTKRSVVLCHDRELRNSPDNATLDQLVTVLDPGKRLMIDIKAFGLTDSKKLARSVCEVISKRPDIQFYLCSFNEYCVDELIGIKQLEFHNNWFIGVISSGIPLGMFDHLDLDFVSLDYNIVCEDIMERFHDRRLLVFVWVVNDPSMQRMMREYNVNGLIYDVHKK
jgi:glycerophosphoryl diester phosphodiesterase